MSTTHTHTHTHTRTHTHTATYTHVRWGWGRPINMPISTEGSGTPTTRPKTGSPV